MSGNVNRYLKPALSVLALFVLVSTVTNMARPNPHLNTKAKERTTLTASLKLEVENKPRYFLGETPTVTISLTNTTRSEQTVKEAEYQKFSLEMTGIFENDTGQQNKSFVYDGSWDIPKGPTKFPQPGETHVFEPLRKREPKFVKLPPGESTNLTLDLSRIFGSHIGVSKYKLTVKSEDGQKVVKEFEVYFDNEKSVPVLAKMLASDSDDVTERHWAVFNLAKFNRPKFVSLLEELIKSGNKKQREFASGMLAQTKAGWFDALKIKVEGKDRLPVGENPMVAISIENGSSTPQTIKEAQDQNFLLELRRVLPNDSKQETKTCVYTPKDSPQKPRLVTLGESKSTTLILNLTECFGARLDAGKYELIVRAADQEEIKDQTAVRRFEVF